MPLLPNAPLLHNGKNVIMTIMSDKPDNNDTPTPKELAKQISDKQAEGVQFLRKAKYVDTGIESPIQGPVLDEKPRHDRS